MKAPILFRKVSFPFTIFNNLKFIVEGLFRLQITRRNAECGILVKFESGLHPIKTSRIREQRGLKLSIICSAMNHLFVIEPVVK